MLLGLCASNGILVSGDFPLKRTESLPHMGFLSVSSGPDLSQTDVTL